MQIAELCCRLYALTSSEFCSMMLHMTEAARLKLDRRNTAGRRSSTVDSRLHSAAAA